METVDASRAAGLVIRCWTLLKGRDQGCCQPNVSFTVGANPGVQLVKCVREGGVGWYVKPLLSCSSQALSLKSESLDPEGRKRPLLSQGEKTSVP